MNGHRRWVAAGLAVVSLAGCTATHEASVEGELVWAVGGSDVAIASEIVELWRTQHPDGAAIRVEPLPRSSDEQRQLLAIELNARIPDFDILSLDVIWTGEFAENGWLASLEGLRGPIERASLPGPLESATWAGELWAAPFTTNAGFLYYRTDLVPSPPTTWDDVMRIGLDRSDEGVVPFVAQGAQYEGLVVNYLEYLWGAGGTLVDESGRVVFPEEPALAALRFMERARREAVFPPAIATMRETEATAMFKRGDAVFMRNWPNAFADVNAADSAVRGRVGIAPLPTFDGLGTAAALGGVNLAVSRWSRAIAAATEFVRFAATSPDGQRRLAARSFAPAMRSVYGELRDDPVMALLGRVLPEARPRPPAPEWSAISDEIQQQVHPAYNGRLDPAEAVRNIRRFVELSARHAAPRR